MQTAHAIDYSDPACKNGARACQNEIVRFVRGIRRPRRCAVTAKQICRWFRVTPEGFVLAQIDEACASGRLRICQRSLSSNRRHNGAYVYEAADLTTFKEQALAEIDKAIAHKHWETAQARAERRFAKMRQQARALATLNTLRRRFEEIEAD